MLEQLEEAYRTLIQLDHPADDEAHRLLTIVNDLRWYADRPGIARWDKIPRSNKWSFEQNLWRLTKQAKKMVAPVPGRIGLFIDTGKMCVGLVGEIYALFEYGESD